MVTVQVPLAHHDYNQDAIVGVPSTITTTLAAGGDTTTTTTTTTDSSCLNDTTSTTTTTSAVSHSASFETAEFLQRSLQQLDDGKWLPPPKTAWTEFLRFHVKFVMNGGVVIESSS